MYNIHPKVAAVVSGVRKRQLAAQAEAEAKARKAPRRGSVKAEAKEEDAKKSSWNRLRKF